MSKSFKSCSERPAVRILDCGGRRSNASVFSVKLDACCWRYCLFPELWLKTLKFLNSPSAQTARIFTRLSQWFYTVNNQRLNNRHLRSDEKYSEGSCSALLSVSCSL